MNQSLALNLTDGRTINVSSVKIRTNGEVEGLDVVKISGELEFFETPEVAGIIYTQE